MVQNAALIFTKLNQGWNADPNSPEARASLTNGDVILEFLVNAFEFPQFTEGAKAIVRFEECQRYRIGTTNDEGWYAGQCRFSKFAPSWGEFYEIIGDSNFLTAPTDWLIVNAESLGATRHYLFYLKDETFECIAQSHKVELPLSG